MRRRRGRSQQLGPAPSLGRDLLVARRRAAVEAFQQGRESVWWWTEPLIPVGVAFAGVFVAAIAPTIAVIAGMAVEPHAGTIAILLVPLVVALLTWAAGSLDAARDGWAPRPGPLGLSGWRRRQVIRGRRCRKRPTGDASRRAGQGTGAPEETHSHDEWRWGRGV